MLNSPSLIIHVTVKETTEYFIILYCNKKDNLKTINTSLHHGVRVKTLLYQNYNKGIKPRV